MNARQLMEWLWAPPLSAPRSTVLIRSIGGGDPLHQDHAPPRDVAPRVAAGSPADRRLGGAARGSFGVSPAHERALSLGGRTRTVVGRCAHRTGACAHADVGAATQGRLTDR